MSVDTLPSPEECNCFAVRAAARHVTQSYDQFLAPTGLRTTQFSILAKLKRKGPLTINALAEDMLMDRTTLGRNILPLERDGLIRIEPAASDRRAKDLRLTKAGEKRFLAALKRLKALNDGVVAAAGISPDDLLITLYEVPGENISFGRGLAQRAHIWDTDPRAADLATTRRTLR